jgi:ligand-binding sensor domain-containing protein
MKKGSFILFALLIKWLFLYSQSPGFSVEKFTTASGLSDNNTSALLQDSRGFLWIGTNNGLTRYDGHVFKQYSILNIAGAESTLNGENAAIRISNTNSTNNWILRAGATGTATPVDGFTIADNNAYRLAINSAGFVGIGTTAPLLCWT